MHTLKATDSSSLSLPADNYIYSITASAPGSFAAISSDDSLRVFDAANLDRVAVISQNTHEKGVTSLRTYSAGAPQLLVTGGRDGKVRLWDVRAGNGSAAVEMETGELLLSFLGFLSFLYLGLCHNPASGRSLHCGLHSPDSISIGEFSSVLMRGYPVYIGVLPCVSGNLLTPRALQRGMLLCCLLPATRRQVPLWRVQNSFPHKLSLHFGRCLFSAILISYGRLRFRTVLEAPEQIYDTSCR